MTDITPEDVVAFWRAAGPEQWFASDPEFDRAVRSGFLAAHEAAAAGKLVAWEKTHEGTLALLILLDQFPRNMFRGQERAFATDALARAVAERALASGFDQAADPMMRSFFYLPFMHSEALADQERCVRLYQAANDVENLRYATEHRDVIKEFGRFPHRNTALGRVTTSAEQVFLDRDGADS